MTVPMWIRSAAPVFALSACVGGSLVLARVLRNGPATAAAAAPITTGERVAFVDGLPAYDRTRQRAAELCATIRSDDATARVGQMFILSGLKEVTPAPIIAPPPTEPEAPEERPPNIRVSSIIGTRQGPQAFIGGRLYRPGQSPAEGWVIETIDLDNRSIVLVSQTTGRRVQIGLQ